LHRRRFVPRSAPASPWPTLRRPGWRQLSPVDRRSN